MASLVFVECLVFIWKGSVLPYPDDILAVEIILLFVVGGLETARLFWGMKGNLTERRLATFISISMALTSLTGALYFVLWQTYVLYIEAIIFIIHMALIVLETILAIVTFAAVQKSINLQNPIR
ncbi:TMEM216 [Bugula neritina]|uniref:TMEM216 n=1 Tax=Bugula neritina TaxID=10212 RepID=A0A7J7KM01_BUGNE|nr:TMEM216 [Bugula neritina]